MLTAGQMRKVDQVTDCMFGSPYANSCCLVTTGLASSIARMVVSLAVHWQITRHCANIKNLLAFF